ncbi:hypothetical protein [Brucella tritici]|uniref:hypothetical protein n=1 Tax=Brucella tritici TaxID=94626 RepID=UPI0020019810|nr:hypothetical protein [Brucella tritici]
MTVPVPDQLEYISNADGVTKDFPYPKRFLQKDEIVVLLRDADGVDTPQILNTHYTIAGSSWPSGGTISFITAPQAPNKVVRYRMTQAKQTVDLENNQRNDAPSVELQLDRLTMGLQDRGARGDLTWLALIAEIAARKLGDAALNTRIDSEAITRAAADEAERNARIAADNALASGLNTERAERIQADTNERVQRIAGDKALASLIGQAGPIEVPVFDTRLAVTLARIKSTVNVIRTGGFALPGDAPSATYKRVLIEPIHICKVQSLDGAWWEMVIENNLLPATCVGFFGKPGVDRTEELQALIDGVPDFLTIVFERSSYAFKAITVTKSLVLDWNSSTLTVDPERDSTSSASPAMYFSGEIGARVPIIALSNTQSMTDRVVVANSGDAALFAPGDYVEISDTAFIPPWDDGLPGQIGTGFVGRKELNRILRILGETIYLEKSVEWAYDTSPQIGKITPLIKPGVENIKTIHEPDPGAQYTGSTVHGPHLMCFRFCVDPLVEGVFADQWQLHVCQFSVCDNPIIRYSGGKNPYRPNLGGHGYFVQFDRCNKGLSYRNEGTRLRHLTDFTQCYDCISQENVAYAPWGAQYGGHGQGAKRIKSIDDTVHLGGGEFPCGWNSGNPTFAGDIDFDIIRPKAYGRCDGTYSSKIFAFGYTTTGVNIYDPVVQVASSNAATYTIGLEVAGGRNIRVIGGDLDWQWTNGGHTSDGAFNIHAVNGVKSSNVEILGTRVRGSRSNNTAMVRASDIDGVLRIKGCTMTTSKTEPTSTPSAILITGTTEELDITENRIRGSGFRGISVVNEPTRNKRIRDNVFEGTWTTALHGVAGT